jgi:cation:H+ antiporter
MEPGLLVALIGGAALLVGGAELLVRGASRIALAAGVPSLVIGLTVVAFGTSAPELAVSVGASLADEPGIAVGNVVGSNIFNVLLILGVSALVVPLAVQSQLVRLDLPVMVAASVVLIVLAFDGTVGRGEGVLLMAALFVYTTALIVKGRRQTAAAPAADSAVRRHRAGTRALLTAAVFAVAGLVLLVAGSRWFVRGAVDLALLLGVSDVVIGLTIIAAGTSLPELATSVLASVRGERDIAIGNVVGSNIFNILGIAGLCSVLTPGGLSVAPSILAFDLPVMLAAAVLALPIFISGMSISRGEGLLFLSFYAAYVTYLLLRSTQHDALTSFTLFTAAILVPATILVLALGGRGRRSARRGGAG